MRKRKSGVMALILVLLCGPGLTGCVFLPANVEDHVDSCESDTFPLTLELQASSVGSCDAYCGAFLLAVGAATLTVSTVIVLVGNTAYYIDKSIRCDELPPLPLPGGESGVAPAPDKSDEPLPGDLEYF